MVSQTFVDSLKISTHALRKEGDFKKLFYLYINRISTHTLRKEGDLSARDMVYYIHHFNPHPPQGG